MCLIAWHPFWPILIWLPNRKTNTRDRFEVCLNGSFWLSGRWAHLSWVVRKNLNKQFNAWIFQIIQTEQQKQQQHDNNNMWMKYWNLVYFQFPFHMLCVWVFEWSRQSPLSWQWKLTNIFQNVVNFVLFVLNGNQTWHKIDKLYPIGINHFSMKHDFSFLFNFRPWIYVYKSCAFTIINE